MNGWTDSPANTGLGAQGARKNSEVDEPNHRVKCVFIGLAIILWICWKEHHA